MALTRAYPENGEVLTQISGTNATLNGNKMATWVNFLTEWSTPPVFITSITEGDVWLYTYGEQTSYRLVPTDGVSSDSFYSDFTDPILSNLLVRRNY